jgi:hypothetical protein
MLSDRSVLGVEPLMVKNYSTGLKLFRNVYKNAAQEERMEVAIVLPIAAGKYSLKGYWKLAG